MTTSRARDKAIVTLCNEFPTLSKITVSKVLRDCSFDTRTARKILGECAPQSIAVKETASTKVTNEDVSEYEKENTMEGDTPTTRTKRKAATASTSLKKQKKVDTYIPTSEEILEDETLEVMGEQLDNISSKDLPMRTLNNFVLYDIQNNNKMCYLDDIGVEGMNICASGDVGAIFVDDEDDEVDEDTDDGEESGPPATTSVQLSCIFFFQVYMSDDGDSEIWLQTQYAWYKLLKPSEDYQRFYDPIFTRTVLANIAEQALSSNPKTTYKAYLTMVDEASANPKHDHYSIDFTEHDVKTNALFILEELEEWADELQDAKVLQAPLVTKLRTLARGKQNARLTVDQEQQSTRVTIRKKKSDKEDANATCVTPHIAAIAKDMFIRRLVEIKGATEGSEAVAAKKRGAPRPSDKAVYKSTTKRVTWVNKPVAEEDGCVYYDAAEVDGEIIKVGDCVYLRNDDPTEPWFARVMYFFGEGSDRMVHVRYFSHGRETILKEFAGERELFLLDNCSDNDARCIMGKCNLVFFDGNDREPVTFDQKDWWFYRFWYDPDKVEFEDARIHEDINPQNYECRSCNEKLRRENEQTVQWQDDNDNSFALNGYTYHVHDYVYITTGEQSEPYLIGQILELSKNSTTAQVRIFERAFHLSPLNHHDAIKNTNLPYKDSRLLHYTEEKQDIAIMSFEGTCRVEHASNIEDLAAYKRNRDSFYVTSLWTGKETKPLAPELLLQCSQCQHKMATRQIQTSKYLENVPKLVGLDIFSGCGGLTCGIDMSGVVDTKYAVEFTASAAYSFEQNFPDAIVYNQCANVLLDRAIAQYGRNEKLKPMMDHLGRPLPDMPRPGDIDLIYCGPPCQGFSGINRFQRADDIKNTLVCTALSYVDFYQPKYFLLENVRGLLTFKLGNEQIQMGVVKYILRCLTSMGYQTRFTVAQAGSHGVAQSRRRFLIWGAKMGHTLPTFPLSSTCFPCARVESINLPDGNVLKTAQRSNGQAPLPHITVGDAISDLPGFEYKNTHRFYPDSPEYKKIRETTLVKQYSPSEGIIGEKVQEYTQQPLTDFQASVREGATVLHNHFTRIFNDVNIERIYNIDMKANSDHHSLPTKLKPWCLSHQDSAASRHHGWKGLFGRLDFEGQFKTTLTEMQPMGKQGTVIHPNQRRVLSVRECARAQGFPDSFVFHSVSKSAHGAVKDMYRQVGNAVPIPLGFALGNQLKEAVIDDWIKQSADISICML